MSMKGRGTATGLAVLLSVAGIQGAMAQPAPAPAPMLWNKEMARELHAYVKTIGREGLDPADYRLTELQAVIDAGRAADLDAAATRTFGLLAHDLADGHAPRTARKDNHFPYPSLTPDGIERLMELALVTHTVSASLQGLLPVSSDYRALKAALAATPASETERRTVLRVNMDRWRWLPRNPGKRYVVVNIPAYELRLIEDGEVRAVHRVIVGKAKTQTPEFAAMVTSVVLNPDWTVPSSIVAESLGKLIRTRPAAARAQGYEWSIDASGALRVRQKPGPTNALGQYKLNMPNPYSIYVHDTPSKQLFERSERAYSHGCVRVEQPAVLVGRLLEGTDWDAAKIERTIVGGALTTAPLAQPMPIFVTYFTASADRDGGIAFYKDLYRRDDAIAKALGPGAKVTGTVAQVPADEQCGLG